MRPASAVVSRPRAPGAIALYAQLARRSFRRMTTYRGATFAGVFTNTVFGFLRAYVLLAVLDARPGVGGFDASDALTYTFVTQGLLATVYAFGDTDIANRIRTGDVVADLYRPVDFQGYWLATDIGRAGFHAIFRGVPPVLIGAIAFDLRWPPTAAMRLAFAVSLVLAVVVSFGLRFLVSLTGFWLLDTRGVWQIVSITSMFLAGLTIPLSFLPDALATVARWLPFASIAQLPIELFLGKHRALVDIVGILARQAMWASVVLGAGRLLGARAYRKVVVQGG
jgi:ABC-2 type transport system permease protein